MTTCLVTGGAGFLGSHLCDALLARGHRVICVDNLETGSLANVAHLRDADQDWLRRLITRIVPLERWREALEKRDDDIKVVVEISRR